MSLSEAPIERLFNTPLECGLRLLYLLNASKPKKLDLQRLITYDYLLVHSGDVDDSLGSLHPAVPFRGTEWLVTARALHLLQSLDALMQRGAIGPGP
jgi:hypothetical protein